MPRTKTEHHPHEIILELHPDAHPHPIPHFIDVKRPFCRKNSDFGIGELDDLLEKTLPSLSVSRVYIPEEDTDDPHKGLLIGDHYNKEEKQLGFADTYLLSFDTHHRPLNILCGQLKKLRAVKDARLNYIVETQHRKFTRIKEYVNDGLWGLKYTNCHQAWTIEKGLRDVTIAVIDTGIDTKHEAFAGRISERQYDFVHKTTMLDDPFRYRLVGDFHTPDPDPTDYSGHGTQCTGIAVGNPATNGFSGVCPGASILPLRVFYSYQDLVNQSIADKASEVDISAAIHYAVNSGADVISMSFGASKKLYQSALEYAARHNVCLIAASGNQGYTSATYPASDDRVLAVGAINREGKRIGMSNYGDRYQPFMMAPGQNVICPHLGGRYFQLTGTSMAAPFVAGAAGLILSLAKRKGKVLEAKEVYDILMKSAKSNLIRGKQNKYYGNGILNVEKALKETLKRGF